MTTTTDITPEELRKRLEILRVNGHAAMADKLELEFKSLLYPDIPYGSQQWLNKFITADAGMIEMKHRAGLLASTTDTVLIHGDSGVGKELIARAIHGDKKPDKFIGINCAGLPDGLIESELFGHMKGSFTGASGDSIGLFAAAEDGTVFLDEVGELPMAVQAKLLRVLQERTVRRVGGKCYEPINCRVIAATHRNLEKRVESGEFREDLMHRLNTFVMEISALHERPDDVMLISEALARKLESEHKPKRLWPIGHKIPMSAVTGNVRSIYSIIRRYHVWGILP